MKIIKTDIIPKSTTIVEVDAQKELDLKAICIFTATGYFLDSDTYWKNKKVLKPGCVHNFDGQDRLIESKPYFKWYYSPRAISFEQALDEFEVLFEKIVGEQTDGKSVILPLSAGLDSRTQAVALRNHPHISTYSYSFKGGYPEDKVAQKIANRFDFPFHSYTVQMGYLWNCIEELAEINQCYSEFTHPRQMAFMNNFKEMGNVFSLGHMGDLFFDSMHLPQLTLEEEVAVITNKLLKKGGLQLATTLWKSWGLEGEFESYLKDRISKLLAEINIEEINVKLRAFKTMYSVTRWSSNNLSIFEKVAAIELPYYDNRMCEFVCTIPEKYLADRQLQIAYIKRKAPELAKITWQEQKPFNLNNYHLNKAPYNLPYRITNKLKREFNGFIGKPHISRNWELQFLGKENDKHLKKWLFDAGLSKLVPEEVIQQFYTNFKEKDAVRYSHPVSMLLTLALFNKKFNK